MHDKSKFEHYHSLCKPIYPILVKLMFLLVPPNRTEEDFQMRSEMSSSSLFAQILWMNVTQINKNLHRHYGCLLKQVLKALPKKNNPKKTEKHIVHTSLLCSFAATYKKWRLFIVVNLFDSLL